MAALPQYTWIIAIHTIGFVISAFSNGANDVANSYATSVAARTLTMPQVGFLAMCTEFFGAVVLGAKVTGTIKNDVIDLNHFSSSPAVLMLAMVCAEVGNSAWLFFATKIGYPVSTTQTVIGALVGSGLAAGAQVSWGWKKGSVSQIAASWVVAPLISAAFSAILFGTLKFTVLERANSFEKAMKAIPFYLAFTAAVLALFITVEAPGAPSLEELGAGTACGIVLGVFFGVLGLVYAFFVPYVHRRLAKQDSRIRFRHIVLGPLLWREDPPIFWPAKDGDIVIDYYASARQPQIDEKLGPANDEIAQEKRAQDPERQAAASGIDGPTPVVAASSPAPSASDVERAEQTAPPADTSVVRQYKKKPEPEERFLAPYAHLPMYHPTRIWSYVKYWSLQGVTRDCVTHASSELEAIHGRAKRYDNRVEHLWTYAQVASAMMMSIAHGSNDVANAIGPWVASYQVYMTGVVSERTETPIFILVAAGFLLGAGFWFMGHHIVKAMGNKLTQMSPTRGFSMELGAAITVLLASRLGLPVSTTQCLTGAVCGVALMNLDVGAVNWRQIGVIFSGWILTLPSAGILAFASMSIGLNTPHWT